MELFIKISQFVLSLSLIIVLHELGHYLPAKYFKIKVEKFYLFFDVKFSLLKKKIGETEWGIGWLPLGGYVKIAGMIDESMDKEQMAKPSQPWEFRSKPSWQRLIVMLGGVTVNFITAAIIFIAMAFIYGTKSTPLNSIKDGFMIENPILLESGFKTGDKILSVDEKKLNTWEELRKSIIGAKKYKVDRNGEIIDITLPDDLLGQLSSSKNMSSFELRMPFIIQSVSEKSLNKDYDLKQGDRMVSVNGEEIKYFDQLVPILNENSNSTIDVELIRDNVNITETLKVDENGKLGIVHGATQNDMIELGLMEVTKNKHSFLESIPVGGNRFLTFMSDYFDQLAAIFNPSTGAYKGLGGFIAIGNIFSPTWDWEAFWFKTAFLSIMLGVLNLLPIPALDGGHAMFLIYEMISGRKPSDKFMEKVQVIGFTILLALVIYANGNDIYKLFNFIF